MSKLEEMLKYVSEHNEFYKNIIHEYSIIDPTDITQWPILTRKQLQENRYNMFSDGYKSKYFNQQLRRQSSSGSTGIPVNVYWDYKDLYASNMALWRKRFQWYGIKPSDKYAMFSLSALDVSDKSSSLNYTVEPSNLLSFNTSLIKEDKTYDEIIEKIDCFRPKWLYIQPFVLEKIICAYFRTGRKPPDSIKYIESVGEVLSSTLKKQVTELFCVPLANMYGSEEVNGIAIENPNGLMEILNDNVFVEVKNNNHIYQAGRGEAVITNLHNHAMPIIRYSLNDDIELEECQKNIIVINGRCIDTADVSNYKISTLLLCDAVSDINNQYKNPIVEYAFSYDKRQSLLTVLVKLKNRAISDVLMYELEKKIKDFILIGNDSALSIDMRICDNISHIKNHILIVGDDYA